MKKKYIFIFMFFMVIFASVVDYAIEITMPFDDKRSSNQLVFDSIAGAIGGVIITYLIYYLNEKKKRRRHNNTDKSE